MVFDYRGGILIQNVFKLLIQHQIVKICEEIAVWVWFLATLPLGFANILSPKI